MFALLVKLVSEKSHGMWLRDRNLCVDYLGVLAAVVKMLKLRAGERPPKVNQGAFALGKYYEILDLIDKESDRRQKIKVLPIYVMPNDEAKITRAFRWLKEQSKVFDDTCGYFQMHDYY
jgi:hypothetical protein